MSEPSDQDRSIAFARRFHNKLASRVVPFRWGSAYLEDDVRLRYGSNWLWVDGSPADATAEGLIAEADRILGGEGFEHRVVGIDDLDLTERLAPDFAAAGWDRTQLILMVLRSRPALEAIAAARRVTHVESRDLLEKLQCTYEPPRSEETIKTLADYPAKLEKVVGAQFYAAEAEGVLSSICDLYLDGTEAQIESVNTLPEHRNQGLATAIMVAAIDAATEAGADWIHLFAEANDWPRHWYQKLGFEVAGHFSQFHVYPDR